MAEFTSEVSVKLTLKYQRATQPWIRLISAAIKKRFLGVYGHRSLIILLRDYNIGGIRVNKLNNSTKKKQAKPYTALQRRL